MKRRCKFKVVFHLVWLIFLSTTNLRLLFEPSSLVLLLILLLVLLLVLLLLVLLLLLVALLHESRIPHR